MVVCAWPRNIVRMDGGNPDVRTCSNCHVKKELDKFVGKTLTCQRCLERKRQYRANNPEKVKQWNHRYKEENEEQINAKRKEYNEIEIDCEFANVRSRNVGRRNILKRRSIRTMKGLIDCKKIS